MTLLQKILRYAPFLFIVMLALAGCATQPKPAVEEPRVTPEISPGKPAPDALTLRYLNKASEYEKSGELRKSLQMLEIVSSLRPDDKEMINKIERLKAKVNARSLDHFNKGVSYYNSNSMDAARKEFILALFYDPGHREALDYLKNRLYGGDYLSYEVKEGDTPETIATKVYNDPQKGFLVTYFSEQLTQGMTIKLPDLGMPRPKEPVEKEEVPFKPPAAEEPPAPKVVFDVPEMLKKANNLFKAKKYQEVVPLSEKILEHDRNNKPARELLNAASYQMGKTLTVSKKYQEAIDYFNRVEPGYKDVKESKALAEKRLAEVHYVTGIKHFVNDEFEKAIKEWDLTLKLNPGHQKAKKDIENAQNLIKKLQELR